MVKRIILILLTAMFLCMGYSDDDESSGDESEINDTGTSNCSYVYTDENVSEPFHAYDRTQFQIRHNGNYNCSFSITGTSTGETIDILAYGYGGVKILKVYSLVEDDYLLDVETDEGCTWEVQIDCIGIAGGGTGGGTGTDGDSSGNDTDDNEPEFGQGCCSSHGGAAKCENGRVVCVDGTLSPTCTCDG